LVSGVVDAFRPGTGSPDGYLLVLNGLLLAALWAYRTDPPRRPVRPWLLAYLAGVVLLGATVPVGIQPHPEFFPLLDWAGVCTVAVVVTAIAHRPTPAWRLALTLLATAVLGLRLVSLPDYLGSAPPYRGTAAAIVAAQALALVAVAVYLKTSRRSEIVPP
jgi:hypothetical protein